MQIGWRHEELPTDTRSSKLQKLYTCSSDIYFFFQIIQPELSKIAKEETHWFSAGLDSQDCLKKEVIIDQSPNRGHWYYLHVQLFILLFIL